MLTEELDQSVSFLHLLKQELEPYCDDNGRRIYLDGPVVELSSKIAVPLGMAIHELSTNAAKHGALAYAEGRVEVDWCIVTRNDSCGLLCEWSEHNGPTVSLPTFYGFGLTLLNRVLSQQIGAEVDVKFDTKGFRLRIFVPLHRQLDRHLTETAASASLGWPARSESPLSNLR